MGGRNSDCVVVLMKRVMIAEGRAQRKGAVQMRKKEPHTAVGNSVGHSDDTGIDPASRRALIAAKARNKPKEQFNNLLHHLTYELIEECLAKIPSNSAPGVDGMTVTQARQNLAWVLPPILEQIRNGTYIAPAVRRVYIPKADGKQRPLGVPAIIDRAIQAAMAEILNEIYEQDFLRCSFGFRPKIGCHQALATVNELLHKWKLNHALEVDIRDFFGSLSHDWLRKFLGLRIGDKRVLKLIDAWLKAGVMEAGKWQATESGVPQGGSISPLLANVYLHYVLDLWWEKKIKKQLRGPAHLVRYADDFVILFKSQEEAQDVKLLLKARLEQFDLTLSEEKTHMTDLTPRGNSAGHDRRRLTFLGFNIFRATNRNGVGWKTVYQTDGKRFTRAKAAMKEKLIRMRHHAVESQAKAINAVLRGHFNYYGIAGNTRKLMHFWHFTLRYWHRSLSRRSQKGYVQWEKMRSILDEHPLVHPQIRISYRELASYVRL